MEALLIVLIKVFIIFNVIMGLASVCTWIERKGSALIQDRIGANRAGAFFEFRNPLLRHLMTFCRIAALGFAALALISAAVRFAAPQSAGRFFDWPVVIGFAVVAVLFAMLAGIPSVIRAMGILGVINTLLCDAVKALTKEDFIPEGTSNFMHSLAPFMAVVPIFLSFALVPLAPDFEAFGHVIHPQLATLDVGVLFIFAMGSISVYGVAIAGWSGNNKYSLLGGLRAAAQMISYELAMGVTLVTVILIYGTLDLYQMVEVQSRSYWGIITQPLSFVILFIVGMAETKRGPFDLPEAESELAAGYFTEYSGMKFLLFWLGEFAEIALFACLIVLIFLGGWHLPFLNLPKNAWWAALIGHAIFMGKVLFICVFQIVLRWTLPRFRYDQLMTLGWKILLPLSMANLMLSAAVKVWR